MKINPQPMGQADGIRAGCQHLREVGGEAREEGGGTLMLRHLSKRRLRN
jgi:hypothetical protein